MNENEVVAINAILQQTHGVDDFRQDILDINQSILNFLRGGDDNLNFQYEENRQEIIVSIITKILRYRGYLGNVGRYVFDNLHRGLSFVGHENPRILILGSAPGMRTLNNQPDVGTVYYFSRSNRFWNILGGLYGDEVSGRIFERDNNLHDVYNIQNDFCIEHNIALRDRIHVFFSVGGSSRDDRRVPIVFNRITTNQNLVVVSNGLGLLRYVNEPMQQIKFEDDEINQRLRNEINLNTRDYQLGNLRLLFLKSTSGVAGTRIQDWNLDVWNA